MAARGDKRILFIRGVLWMGIVADFINALQYCFPQSTMDALGIVWRLTTFPPRLSHETSWACGPPPLMKMARE
jgi:hypothetical protein